VKPGAAGRASALLALVLGGCSGGAPDGPLGPEPASDVIEAAGARLHSVLDLPAGPGPFRAVVIGHGSGRATTSDGAGYVPFLLARGFAVLRYDKRGVGQSTGTYRGVSAANSDAQIAELAGDMVSALAFLAARPEIDARRLGLMGTSQAGWVMVEAAARSPLAHFAIAVTGSVEPVGVNIAYENLRGQPIDAAYAQLALYEGPRGYDPVPVVEGLAAPTLWLLGGEDRLVPSRDCVTILNRLRAGGSPAEFVVYPGEGHGLPGADYWPDIDAFLARTQPF
jgi:dienelactone hydrolase